MNGGLTLKIKTPHQPVYVGKFDYNNVSGRMKITKAFQDAMAVSAGTVLVPVIANRVDRAKKISWRIVATFFQRVVARTPIDEDYFVEYQNGKKRNYKRDENSCKLDWYIQYRNKKIYSKDIIEEYGNIFKTYNDKKSINTLEKYFKTIFVGTETGKVTAIIGNDNPHFAVLEYGGIKGQPNKEIKGANNPPDILSGEKIKTHRLKNGRSTQAPYGMLRITEAELESIVKDSKRNPGDKFKNMLTSKAPRKEKAMKLIKILKKSGKIPLEELSDFDFRKLK